MPNSTDLQFTVAPCMAGGFKVKYRKTYTAMSPGTFEWGCWRNLNLDHLNEVTALLSRSAEPEKKQFTVSPRWGSGFKVMVRTEENPGGSFRNWGLTDLNEVTALLSRNKNNPDKEK